ncbi:iron-containing redox enzyme family protein [Cellulomonas bogoriensis]|uniref:Iron-containing redox enzyme family protein n=1 Tax=Cellulomonas bogoriensis 69B4 = DSM 16987 TaxID=1386082 RepID=A0A0A0BKF5_9CELL|nr:iron-containing redox enzyme family protein [Cellulomonas bogoriensis]KGM09008.1 hypothetical protein N869_03670 [Cellulomonas bogoriensis 69B4 = DSM 16987]
MRPPAPRGPLGTAVGTALRRSPEPSPTLVEDAREAVARAQDALCDDDVQTTLLTMYELHYRGLDGVDERWEWHPDLLAARAVLEDAFESAVRAVVPVPATGARTAGEIAEALFELTADDSGPGVSGFIAKRATDDQAREFLIHRSIYHLKEADPHSWALPRLTGRPKSALIEIQADEYGGGRPGYLHAELYGATLRAVGLDDTYGAYVDVVPAPTLANVNLMSLFGLHRRLRGAIAGHLAAFEMTSSIPSRRYGHGFRRLGYGPDVTGYFDEHVEADAVHEQIAGRDLAGALAEAEPSVRDDVLWGAGACLALEERAGRHMLDRWEQGRTALREARPLAA